MEFYIYPQDLHRVEGVIPHTSIQPLSSAHHHFMDDLSRIDLFDNLDRVIVLRDQGMIQNQIGEEFGWSREMVFKYVQLLDKIAPEVF